MKVHSFPVAKASPLLLIKAVPAQRISDKGSRNNNNTTAKETEEGTLDANMPGDGVQGYTQD